MARTQTTVIGAEIAQVAKEWARRDCRETISNGGSCIDDVQQQFYGTKRREPYCAAFAWVVVDQACRRVGIPNILPKTPGALDMLRKSKRTALPVDKLPTIGSVFYRKTTARASGHIGIVIGMTEAGNLITVEGNNDDRIGVFENRLDAVLNSSNGWQFIHTDLTPGGEGVLPVDMAPDGSFTVSSGGVNLAALLALGLVGYGVYRVAA